jgi:hypothetical protein
MAARPREREAPMTLAAMLLGYCVLTTVVKRCYIRHFGWQ